MKILSTLCIVVLALTACSSPDSKNTVGDTIAKDGVLTESTGAPKTTDTTAITSLCFVRTEGTNNQDSTTVNLVMKGHHVTGEMIWSPYQKDSRKGILSGTRKNDLITAVWTFKQEGMTDTMRLEFQLSKDKLSQKPLNTNPKTGRQETDASAGYTVVYQPFLGSKK